MAIDQKFCIELLIYSRADRNLQILKNDSVKYYKTIYRWIDPILTNNSWILNAILIRKQFNSISKAIAVY